MERKFYQKTWFIVIMLIVAPPMGAILALINPFYPSKPRKIIGGFLIAITLFAGIKHTMNPSASNGKIAELNSQKETQIAQSQDELKKIEEKEATEKIEQARIEQQKKIEQEQTERAEQARREAELANKRKNDNVIEIIRAVEDIEIAYESNKSYANFAATPSSEENMQNNINTLDSKRELFEADILGKFIEFVDSNKKDGLSSSIYSLYAEDRYGDFSEKPIGAIRTGNILRENVLPKDYHSNKYGYEIVNGFLEGNNRYPVLSYSGSIYKFNHALNKRNNNATMLDENNKVIVLDVESIVYHDGFVYVNTIGLKREIAYGSDDKKSDWKLISPSLYRFMILSTENAKKGNYTPLKHSDLQNIRQLKDVAIIYEEANLVSNSLSSDSTWNNIQRDIKEWYNPSLFRKETFRIPENSSCLHLHTEIGSLKEMWDTGPINRTTSDKTNRDIFLFAIYKLIQDNQ